MVIIRFTALLALFAITSLAISVDQDTVSATVTGQVTSETQASSITMDMPSQYLPDLIPTLCEPLSEIHARHDPYLSSDKDNAIE